MCTCAREKDEIWKKQFPRVLSHDLYWENKTYSLKIRGLLHDSYDHKEFTIKNVIKSNYITENFLSGNTTNCSPFDLHQFILKMFTEIPYNRKRNIPFRPSLIKTLIYLKITKKI